MGRCFDRSPPAPPAGRVAIESAQATATTGRRPIISAKIFVGNLSFQTTKDQLTDLLSDAGEVIDVYLPSDRATGRPRGFAFVEFSSEEEAEAAIEQFNDHELDGRSLRINAAEERPPRAGGFRPSPGFGPPPGGGGGGGKGGRPSRPKGSRRGLRRKKRSL